MPKAEPKSTISELNLSYKLFSESNRLEFIIQNVTEAYPEYGPPEPIMTLEEPPIEEESPEQETAQSQQAAAPVPTPVAVVATPIDAEEEDPDAPRKKIKKEPILFIASKEKDMDKWNVLCMILFQQNLYELQNDQQMECIEILDKLTKWAKTFYLQDSFSVDFFTYVMDRLKLGKKCDIGINRNISAIKEEFKCKF
ncbi:hypothetical protein SS50377_22824 [Spironucleus salmonicida]|uniref:Uncharacterized protein n=1 Tax=Spironucleus salmonicida TaxID=348837 RepID=V6LW03_9EUKA|nr:hypothetical protein SS50377_22824 [Spironucleus salmonicida]|eukprot:EST47886.1 Hypothetical protein SS50377_11987 [Spironucleus salmonicida]